MSDLPAEIKNISSTNLIMQGDSFDRVMRMAEIMSSGVATVPKHLQGNVGDCAAIVMQSMQWNMNPYTVGQKTHCINGVLGYEAQLVNSVINSLAPTKDRLQFEWFGDWDKILGNFREVESKTKKDDNEQFKKYRIPNWTLQDEKGLGIKVWATLKGEDKPRELVLMLVQARVRNSTLWADDPKQQLAYLAIKRWSRLYCPDVIMGVYTSDEIQEYEEKEINPIPKDDDQPPPPEPVKYYPDEAFEKNFPKWREAVEKGSKTHDEWINTLTAKFPLTEEQKQKILEVKAPIPGEAVEVQNDNANS